MNRKLSWLLLALLLICFVFRVQLFSPFTVTSGDWPYFFKEAAKEFPTSLVYYKAYIGLGQGSVVFTGLESYYETFGKIIGGTYGWRVFEQFFFIIPLLTLLIISSYLFTRSAIGVVVFSLNTYILMIIGGGQFGVSLAYALSALVLFAFMQVIDRSQSVKNSEGTMVARYIVLAAVASGAQIAIDSRIALITFGAVFLYVLVQLLMKNRRKLYMFFSCFVVAVTALLLNAFWITPLLRFHVGLGEHGNPQDFLPGIVDFLSFADFSHALSLLHPNWPDNIFGKTYFLQPEYLILPIFAFSGLFFISRKVGNDENKKNIHVFLFFTFLGLLGTFLSKGTNAPFGEIYRFLYVHIPGFVMFRDPTKFYILTAVSYTYLIPKSLYAISLFLKEKRIHALLLTNVIYVPYIFFICLFFILLRPVFLSQIVGTFNEHPVPSEYEALKNFLVSDNSFYRILWAPMQSRYGYTSIDNPGLSADLFFRSTSPRASVERMVSHEGIVALQDAGVKYVIVPTDPQSEFFLKDRVYDDGLRNNYIQSIARARTLKRLGDIDDIAIFLVPSPRSHFSFSSDSKASVVIKRNGPERYVLELQNVRMNERLFFSEGFTYLWEFRVGSQRERPSEKRGIMEFILRKGGSFTGEIVYLPSENSLGIGATVLGILLCLALFFNQSRKLVGIK